MNHERTFRWIVAILVVFVSGAVGYSQDIVINEFMASNGGVFADEDGDYEDWIELYNAGSHQVNLVGWGLSDDLESPFRWVFPKVILNPGDYLLVWASGKDRREPHIPGQVTRRYWTDISDTSISSLLNDPSFPDDPAGVDYLSSLEAVYWEDPSQTHDFANNYGQWIYGYIVAPETGHYTFWVSGDDESELWLADSSLPRDAVRIGHVPDWTGYRQWDKYPSQQSSPIYLEAGRSYYVEMYHKEGQGGDSLSVGWSRPGQSTAAPSEIVPGSVLRTYSHLHTNFSISADGEPLILTRPDGTVADDVSPRWVPRDVSFGRVTDGGDVWGFFTEPTPAQSNNNSEWYAEVLPEPQFSHPGGFYTSAFQLTLHNDDPDVRIYYTLDGSEPEPTNLSGRTYVYKNWYPVGTGQTPSSFFNSRQIRTYFYAGPVSITDRTSAAYQLASINTQFSTSTRLPSSNPFKGTIVRARAFKDGALPSPVETHSYFVNPTIENRYNLPVISIVTAEDNLFDYYKGIYVAGQVGDQWRLNNPWSGWNEGQPANYNQRGVEWERPGHFEVFDSSGSLLFSQNIGIRIHGGWSRGWFPKSFRLYARSAYDRDNAFEYPFFAGLEKQGQPGEPLTTFRRLILRNSGNDYAQSYYRDALMQSLVSHLPIDTMAYRPAMHFVNGEFWGMINFRERYDQHHLATHYDMDPDDVVYLTFDHNQWRVIIGTGSETDLDQFNEIVQYATQNDPAQTAHYNWLVQRVDPRNLALYYAIQVYYNNRDWPHNNIDWWRKRTDSYVPDAPYGHDGRWRWMLYDTDFGFGHNGDYNVNSLSRILETTGRGPTNTLFNRMRRNTHFRNLFINALADQINTSFKPARVNSMIDAFDARISSSRSEHNSRWSVGTSVRNEMKTFGNLRPAVMRNHILSAFGLSGTRDVTVSRNENGGHVQVNSIVIDSQTPGLAASSTPYPWTGQYYRGVPVTVRALPLHGYRFSHWMGDISGVNPFSETLTLSQNQDISLTAVFEPHTLLHYWHFNDLTSDPVTSIPADHTIMGDPLITYPGDGDGYLDSTDGSDLNARLGQFAGKCLRVRNPSDTRALVLTLPTTGYEAIQFSYAARRTTSGAETQTLYYRTEESGDWNFFDEVEVSEEYELFAFDFSDVADISNNPEFAVRIVFGGDNASGASGNNRLDNIALEGLPLPGTNQPPRLVAALPFRRMIEATPMTINLDNFFADPDGDELLYTALSSNPDLVATTVDGSLLTLTPLYRGDSVIRVLVEDGVNPPMQINFRALVNPRAHKLREQSFVFDHWAANEPELTYPDHMLFVQSDTPDPGLDAPLDYAYFIPHDGDDGYHSDDEPIIGYPYMTTGRSRINGLDERGIAFINTGRNRDLGGAILALDMTSVESAEVRWLNETLARNVREYAIRLQYRIGHSGPFIDVTDGGWPVEYSAQAEDSIQTFGPIELPTVLMGRPYVQLLWRYYHVQGSSGSRPQLRLDDISVSRSSYPHQNQPHEIPGRIQAERFDVGGQGISYYDTTEGNSGGVYRSNVNVDIINVTDDISGYAVTDIEDGEWLRYTVNSTASEMGFYARVASIEDGGQILVRLDDELVATLDVPNTGSLTTWQTVEAHCQPLPERQGAQLRIEFVGSGFRLNWIDFQNRRPYLGTPHQVPGRIQFEDYDIGGQQISYFDKTSNNGYGAYRPNEGVDIMSITDGGQPIYAVYAMSEEWLEYTCSIEPGFYTVVVRSSSPFGAQQLALFEGLRTAAVITLPRTGGWNTWQSTAVSSVHLTGGENQVLRLNLLSSTAQLHYVELIREHNPADITHSGRVDMNDFAILAAQWLGAAGTPSADIAPLPDGDGVVDLLDLLMLAENWLSED